jgi:hypothetical protein
MVLMVISALVGWLGFDKLSQNGWWRMRGASTGSARTDKSAHAHTSAPFALSLSKGPMALTSMVVSTVVP